MSHREVFAPQYADRSGPGSTLEASAPYREFLGAWIYNRGGVRSVLDLPCGDGVVMGGVDLHGASYLGVDVIPERIELNRRLYPGREFLCADLTAWPIPPADLAVSKDFLQHLSTAEALTFVADLLAAPIRFALVTNCVRPVPGWPDVNADIPAGHWRPLDLTRPPFGVGEVIFRWATKEVVLLRGAAWSSGS